MLAKVMCPLRLNIVGWSPIPPQWEALPRFPQVPRATVLPVSPDPGFLLSLRLFDYRLTEANFPCLPPKLSLQGFEGWWPGVADKASKGNLTAGWPLAWRPLGHLPGDLLPGHPPAQTLEQYLRAWSLALRVHFSPHGDSPSNAVFPTVTLGTMDSLLHLHLSPCTFKFINVAC